MEPDLLDSEAPQYPEAEAAHGKVMEVFWSELRQLPAGQRMIFIETCYGQIQDCYEEEKCEWDSEDE